MYSAELIANYIISYCNENSIRITNWKLQNLLYFVQGEFLKSTGRRLIKEDFYAWRIGPTIPKIYTHFSEYSSFNIPKENYFFFPDLEANKIIDWVLIEYAEKSVFDLADLAKSQAPWKYNYEIFGNKSIISFEDFRNSFDRKT